jgi:hypothetical protein
MSIKLVHSIVAYFILKSSRDQGIKGLGHKFESCWAGQKPQAVQADTAPLALLLAV